MLKYVSGSAPRLRLREANILNIRHKKGKIVLSTKLVSSLYMSGQAESCNVSELRQITTERLQSVMFVGIGIAPTLEADMHRPAIGGNGDINGL